MAKRTYPAIIEAGAEGYGVTFPDLPGCVSFGADLQQALDNAAEALSLHMEGMAEDGQALPEASDIDRLHAALQAAEGLAMVAAISAEEPDKAERVNVYLKRNLLERIDRYCGERGDMNRSTFFVLAAKDMLDAGQRRTERGAIFDHIVGPAGQRPTAPAETRPEGPATRGPPRRNLRT